MDLDVVAIDGWAKANTNYHELGSLKPTINEGVTTATLDGVTPTTPARPTCAGYPGSPLYNEVQTEDALATPRPIGS